MSFASTQHFHYRTMRELIERERMMVDGLNYPKTYWRHNDAGISAHGGNRIIVTYWSKNNQEMYKNTQRANDPRYFQPTEAYIQKQHEFKGIRSSI